MSQKVKLTDRSVLELPIPDRGNKLYFDSEVSGFACRVTTHGARSYIYNYRADGKQRRYTIGTIEKWKASTARKEATRLKGDVARGKDPLGDVREERNAKTVADMCQRFIEEHLPRLRPSSRQDYSKMIDNHIMPALGKKKVSDVEYTDIDSLHRKITCSGAPYVANRCVAVLSKMFALSIKWKWRSDNPAKGIERNHEEKRHRYLSGEEMGRLTEALSDFEDKQAANVVRLLLLTGARKGEVLSARWDQFTDGFTHWIKPGSTTKQKTEHRAPLNSPARQLLTELRDQAEPEVEFIFPGRLGGHRENIKAAWSKILRCADISNLRLHDLRHTYASLLVSSGLSLPIIGAMLGHSQTQTTARYAHLMDDPLLEAAERVGAIVSGKPSFEILPVKKGDATHG